MLKAILFDYDGTIADTDRLIIDSWQHTYLVRRGHPEDEAVILATFGEPLRTSMEHAFPEFDVDETIDIYRSYQAEIYPGSIKAFPGMIELIHELHAAGLRLGIVTSRVRSSTLLGLKEFGIADDMDAVITCEDCAKHKPDPAPALTCLAALGVGPEEAILVGDSGFDTACAHNAGLPAILIRWASGRGAELAGRPPEYTVANAEELRAALASVAAAAAGNGCPLLL